MHDNEDESVQKRLGDDSALLLSVQGDDDSDSDRDGLENDGKATTSTASLTNVLLRSMTQRHSKLWF